jgi:molecular chaperone DnaK (HSP70)
MPGRLAVDFGTSNTVVAVWNEARGEGVPYHLPDLGKTIRYRNCNQAPETISVVPSVIHYAADGRKLFGNQVLQNGLYDSRRTFRWMKRYIARRSPIGVDIDGRLVSPTDAGREFLASILARALTEADLATEEVALTVPVEAYEHYEDWLMGVTESAGMTRYRLIDEPTAAALGYGIPIMSGDVFLIFDFGGGSLDVALVVMEGDLESGANRQCRVLGKAGADLGGATIDGWLFAEVLRQAGMSETDDTVLALSRKLLAACEKAKEALSFMEKAEVLVEDAPGAIRATLTRSQLEHLFDRYEAYTLVDQTIRRALNSARERGFSEDDINSVLLVGGSAMIPAVQRLVQRIFGRDKVQLNRPLDAVARGAAAFVAGAAFHDHIQHDYAIRFVNPGKGDYEFRTLVHRGAPYPSQEPVARMVIKASHDGQTHLGLAVFEIGERLTRPVQQPMELVFDSKGSARVRPVSAEETERRYRFWINESTPTFLKASPPGRRGEPRFEVEFWIDGNKRLLITARDLVTKTIPLRAHPVIQLV